MNEAQRRAMEQALRLLDAAQVPYAVLTPDGLISTDSAESVLFGKPAPRRRLYRHDYVDPYIPILRDNGSASIEVPKHVPLDKAQQATCTKMSAAFGPGNFITTQVRDKHVVDVVVIPPKKAEAC